MDLAYVDKLAKDNNGVKCLLFRQYLFDRTVDAKRLKTKDSKETVHALLTMITKTNQPKKIWVDKGTEFAGGFKNYAKLKEYKLTLQWLHLLNVQYDPSEIYFTGTWKRMDTITFPK